MIKDDPQYIKFIESLIDSSAYLSTLYEFESSRNPKAVNPTSSAKGGFQILNATAVALGLGDPFDLGESLIAVAKLTVENMKRFGTDPLALYSAHYLGATVYEKCLDKLTVDAAEQAQWSLLNLTLLPRFKAMYDKVVARVNTK